MVLVEDGYEKNAGEQAFGVGQWKQRPMQGKTQAIQTNKGGHGFFLNTYLYCLTGCLSIIVWTHVVLGVLYACVLYFCIIALVLHY